MNGVLLPEHDENTLFVVCQMLRITAEADQLYFSETQLKFEKMPKMKTVSSAKKRFTLTATGKIKRKHAFKRHILTKKTTKQKRTLTHSTIVAGHNLEAVRKMLVM